MYFSWVPRAERESCTWVMIQLFSNCQCQKPLRTKCTVPKVNCFALQVWPKAVVYRAPPSLRDILSTQGAMPFSLSSQKLCPF